MIDIPALLAKCETDAHPNSEGCLVHRMFAQCDRYFFDNKLEGVYEEGAWQQFDTDQDARYFGVWVAPTLMMSLTYAEGDISLVTCPSPEAYDKHIQALKDFYL